MRRPESMFDMQYCERPVASNTQAIQLRHRQSHQAHHSHTTVAPQAHHSHTTVTPPPYPSHTSQPCLPLSVSQSRATQTSSSTLRTSCGPETITRRLGCGWLGWAKLGWARALNRAGLGAWLNSCLCSTLTHHFIAQLEKVGPPRTATYAQRAKLTEKHARRASCCATTLRTSTRWRARQGCLTSGAS